jgi:hypothetical protein
MTRRPTRLETAGRPWFLTADLEIERSAKRNDTAWDSSAGLNVSRKPPVEQGTIVPAIIRSDVTRVGVPGL